MGNSRKICGKSAKQLMKIIVAGSIRDGAVLGFLMTFYTWIFCMWKLGMSAHE
jgi:hypothetical protein